MKHSIYALALILSVSACTRSGKTGGQATLRLSTSRSGNSSLSMVVPSGKQFCYGVTVNASDLAAAGLGLCGPSAGVSAGFVAEGGEITLTVNKGSGRKIDLYMYLADTGSTCPAWNASFQNSKSNYDKTYLVGTSGPVSLVKDFEEVAIVADWGTTSSSVLSGNTGPGCGPAQLRGVLYSSGEIRNAADSAFHTTDLSFPSIVSFFKTLSGQGDNLGIGWLTAGGTLNAGVETAPPPYIHSITRSPETGTLFGLDHDGQIYTLDTAGGATALSAAACPFVMTVGCQVPIWIQSVSAGYGGDLYALDHGGNIYSMQTDGTPLATGNSVSEAASQVSYY